MSLELTRRYADKVGVTHIILTPDPDARQIVQVDTDRPISPGAAATLRNRAWMAVCDHRRACSEPASVLDDPWEIRKTVTGAWLVRHEHCAMRSAA